MKPKDLKRQPETQSGGSLEQVLFGGIGLNLQ